MSERAPFSFDRTGAFLFDLDGTLIESDDRWMEKLADRLAPIAGLSDRTEAETLARKLVMATEKPSNYAMSVLEHLGLGSRFFGLADRVRRARGLATREMSETVEGTHELLDALKERYALAVVTTRARPEGYAFLAASGLEPYFPVVITRQDVLRMKPHPEPIISAAGLLGVAPDRCAMVGDTMADITAARRAGAYAIGVLTGFGKRHELERSGADLIVDRAIDILSHPSWDSRD